MSLTVRHRAVSLIEPFAQFVVFGTAPRAGKPGKLDKFPIDPQSGSRLYGWTEPYQWLEFAHALELSSMAPGRGVGFVVEGLHFLDIDGCVTGGVWDPNALELIRYFPGAYVEASISGLGAHVIFRGELPAHGCRITYLELELELYSSSRFCALTGNCFYDHENLELPDHTTQGAELAAVFGRQGPAAEPAVFDDRPLMPRKGPADDAALIRGLIDGNG